MLEDNGGVALCEVYNHGRLSISCKTTIGLQ